nr:SdrD B-like domain-containing protein [uncultured Albidiferax sp.]
MGSTHRGGWTEAVRNAERALFKRCFIQLARRLVGWGLAPRAMACGLRNLGLAVVSFGFAGSALAALGASVTLLAGDPTQIYPGQTTRLQITLSNNNILTPITAVGFSNLLPGTLPNGLRVTGAATYTCTDPAGPSTSAGTGTLITTGQTISLSGGVIPPRSGSVDGGCTIVVPVTAGTSTGNTATYSYTIADGAVTGNDGAAVQNVGAVQQSVNVVALAQPGLSKAFGTGTLVLGGASTSLSVTLTNSNPVEIPNFTVTDLFPQLGGSAVIQVASPSGASASCNNGGASPVVTASSGGNNFSAIGTLPARSGAVNGSCTFTVNVVAAHTNGSYSITQTNTINRSTQFSNDLGIPAANNATADITVRSPLQVSKTVDATSLSNGGAGRFTITLGNSSTSALAISSLVDDAIDGGAAGNLNAYGLKVTGQATSCGGSVVATTNNTGVALTGGSIPAGGSCVVTVDFTGTVQSPNTPRAYTNSLAAGAVDVGNPAIVSQPASSTVTVYQNLNVNKTVSPNNPEPGNPVRYQVTLQNWSSTAINDLVFPDTLQQGQTFLTGTIGGVNYTPSGCGVSVTNGAVLGASAITFGTIAVSARASVSSPGTCTVTFWTMVSSAAAANASFDNTLAAGSVCYGSGPQVCYGSATSASGSIHAGAVLSAIKSFSPAGPLSEGAVSRVTVRLDNLSANQLTNVTLGDNLPAAVSGGGQMRVANPANAATTCTGSPVLTASPNATSFSLNGATVPARASNGAGAAGSCVVQFDVVGPAGTFNNTATVTGTETYGNGLTHTLAPENSNTATLVYTSSLAASKSFSPTSVSSGGSSRVTVRLNNNGAVALTQVAATDPLPSGMLLAPVPNAYTTCAGSTAVTATPGASSISLTGASIAGGSSCDLVFDVVATGSANWVNSIPAGNITAAGGVFNQTEVSATLAFNAPSGLTVAKATNPSTLTFPGQVSQLTITVNNGTQNVTGLRLTDYFTANGTAAGGSNGMVVAANPATSTTCPGGVVTAVAGAESVSLSGAAMAANTACTVVVNVTSVAVGGITNFIPAGSIATDQGLSNSGQATTSLTTQSNLGLTKQFTPKVVQPGGRSRLRITFFNATAQPVSNLSVVDNLPTGVTVPSGFNPSTTCTGATVSAPTAGQVQVAGGNLGAANGAISTSCYAEVDVLVAAQGDYTNTIPAGAISASSGGVGVSNSQPATDVLRAKAPLVVHKAIDSQTLDAGNPAGFSTGSATRSAGSAVSLTIRITNPNATPVTALALTDSLPSGLVVAITPNAATTCTGGTVQAVASGTSVRISGATLAANASCNLLVDVLSNISGTYTNTIAVGAITTFEGISNEEPTSARLQVSTPPVVSKQFAPPVIPPNGTSTLTVFLGNDNPSALTLTAALVDTLPTAPGPVLVAATPNVQTTCPGTVTAAAASSTVSYASGALIPAGGCSISVQVTAATPGTHTNSIAAGALQTNLGNNQQAANAPLTVSTQGFISGRVFRDNNLTPNGTFESGVDTPISGVSVELRAGNSCAGPLVTQGGLANPVATDVLGNYIFAGLPAATYSVCELVQPSNTVNGITTAGSLVLTGGSTGTAGSASNPSATSSQIVGIVLNGDGAGGQITGSTQNNFAEIVPSTIAGSVFLDTNNNGIRNGADTSLAGVVIELLNSANAVVASTTTAADGSYSFGNLLPGTYSVREPSQPAGTSNGVTSAGSVPNGGTAGTASTPAVLPSAIRNIVLPPNTQSVANDFAEIPNGRSVSGRVFLDYNNNGVLNNPPDHGIGGQTVALTGTDINGNPVSLTTTTAADGSFRFSAVPEGSNYTLTQASQPAGTNNGTVTAGSTGGAASNPTATSSRITGIALSGANMVSAENNFAEIPGAVPDLALAKTHAPSNFASGSSSGYFTLTPRNIGTVVTSGTITLTDTLPTGMTVAALATGTGWTCTGAVGGSVVSCTSTTEIAAGASGNPVVVRVAVASGLTGQVLTNTALVSGGGEPAGFDGNNSASDSVVLVSAATVSGSVWRDANHDRVKDLGEPVVPDWTVELLNNGVLVATTQTDSNGAYSFTALAPGAGYEVRFREPSTNYLYGRPVPNESGQSYTAGVVGSGNPGGADNSQGVLHNINLLPGDNILQQSLPLDPAGVVYDAVTRLPVQGAVVTLSGPPGFDASQLLGGALSQTTGSAGRYQFLLLSTAPAGVYTLSVTAPAGYAPGASTLIPVCAATLSVSAGPPDPAVVQTSDTAPTAAAGNPLTTPGACAATSAGLSSGAATTQYYFSFNLNLAFPGGSANVVNNHIPVDPMNATGFVLSKTGSRRVAEVGDTLLYTIVVRRTAGSSLPQVTVRDRLPAGFTYIRGTARVNGLAAPDPAGGVGPVLGFTVGGLSLNQSTTLTYRVRVGVGSMQGTGINTARAYGCTTAAGCLTAALQPVANSIESNEGAHQVQVTGGVFTDQACVLGKIFVDCNRNHIQDTEELGVPGVRMYFESGQYLVSDSEGKYSQCGLTPNSHVLKVDPRTLPTGSRLTTSSNRNLGDANSLFIDLKNGELHRADFVEGSCSNPVMEQVKARRAQGEIRSVETEKLKGPALRFESKPVRMPKQATDSANQPIVQPREGANGAR